MLGTGIKATAMQMYTGHRKLFRVPFGDVDSAFPFTLTTAQTETERVLGEHLQSLGVTVERGVELVALSQDDRRPCISPCGTKTGQPSRSALPG